jgi:malonyl-CoA O-methyltransferase
VLSVRDAYQRWAPHYDTETAVTILENEMVTGLAVTVEGRRVLDAGCGTGRRLRQTTAALTVGVDLTYQMLAQASRPSALAVADVRALPLINETFDVVFCRLVIGHLRDPDPAYAELARVCRPGGTIVVTDFHAAAAQAGHKRTFRDADGQTHEIEHYVHTASDHAAVARARRLSVERCDNGVVGPTIRPAYVAAGRLAHYEAQLGLPLVLALVLRKPS